MNGPIETKPALWGAAGGAVATAIVGFGWGRRTTNSKAEEAASTRVKVKVVEAFAPGCVAKFRRDAAVDASLVALKEVDSWSQGDFIEKGGSATVADSNVTAQASSVARTCNQLLSKAAA